MVSRRPPPEPSFLDRSLLEYPEQAIHQFLAVCIAGQLDCQALVLCVLAEAGDEFAGPPLGPARTPKQEFRFPEQAVHAAQ